MFSFYYRSLGYPANQKASWNILHLIFHPLSKVTVRMLDSIPKSFATAKYAPIKYVPPKNMVVTDPHANLKTPNLIYRLVPILRSSFVLYRKQGHTHRIWFPSRTILHLDHQSFSASTGYLTSSAYSGARATHSSYKFQA